MRVCVHPCVCACVCVCVSCTQDAEARKKNPFGRTGPVRPPPKPFNAEEARNLALAVQRTTGVDGQVMLMMGTHRFVNGYTQRDIALKVRTYLCT